MLPIDLNFTGDQVLRSKESPTGLLLYLSAIGADGAMYSTTEPIDPHQKDDDIRAKFAAMDRIFAQHQETWVRVRIRKPRPSLSPDQLEAHIEWWLIHYGHLYVTVDPVRPTVGTAWLWVGNYCPEQCHPLASFLEDLFGAYLCAPPTFDCRQVCQQFGFWNQDLLLAAGRVLLLPPAMQAGPLQVPNVSLEEDRAAIARYDLQITDLPSLDIPERKTTIHAW